MRKWGFILVAVGALIGLVMSGLSLQHHLALVRELAQQGGAEPSYCSINAWINCDVTVTSRFSTLFGIPTAGFAIVFFAIHLIFLILAWLDDAPDRKPAAALGWWLAALGVIPSGFLLYTMLVGLGVLCLNCLGVDVGLLITFVGWSLAGGMRCVKGADRKEWTRALTTAAVVGAVGVLFLLNVRETLAGMRPTAEAIQTFVQRFAQQPVVEFALDPATHPVWGNPNASVTIIEFSDFQCPHCQKAAQILRPYLAEFRNRVKFIFANYPLDQQCNTSMQQPMHPFACLAARASICANQQGKFWEYHDDIFANQKALSREKLVDLAKARGLDDAKFNACLDDAATDAAVRADIDAGVKAKLTGTPALFINGRAMPAWTVPEVLRAVIDHALQSPK